jgi:hypothetical protein
VGSPPQEVKLHVDTGSSDMWVNTPSSEYCSAERRPCANAGTYDPAHSTTQKFIDNTFNISYVDGSGASGDFVTDILTIGGTTVEGLQFGVGANSSSPRGILGIGYTTNEASVLRDGAKPYENLPVKLASQGHIQSAAFSMFLNDVDSRTGTVLFGGIDKSHFTYLPDAIAKAIYKQVDATYVEDQGLAFVPCTDRDSSHSITFTFDDPLSIVVPYSELVLNIPTSRGRRPVFDNGRAACLFGIAPAESESNVLGDTFMRSAYVVFDLANNEISMAQAAAAGDGTQSDVAEIGVGKSAVPGATRAQNPVTATQGFTNSGQNVTSGAGGQESGAGTDGSRNASGLARGAKAAAVLAGVVTALATVVLT